MRRPPVRSTMRGTLPVSRPRLRTPACEGSFEFRSHRGDILADKARILDLREGEVAGECRGNCAVPVMRRNRQTAVGLQR